MSLKVGDVVRYVGGGRFDGDQDLPGGVTMHVGSELVVRRIPGAKGDLGCSLGLAKVSLNNEDVRLVPGTAVDVRAPALVANARTRSPGPGDVAQTLGDREGICEQLAEADFMDVDHPLFHHGRLYAGPRTPPKVLWASKKPPRDDHSAPDWLTATEFEDRPEVVAFKCRQLAHLMRISRKTVLYTGAGISASAVGQAARSGTNTQGWTGAGKCAAPTATHFALGLLGRENLVHSWVQQNHDGLPQKAGFPQENINEIHGSWYDPGNPVVKYSGSLHERSFPWMQEDAETADLVLVLGTSLGGMNADQVATNVADRTRDREGALGTVIFNLQQTEQDGIMTLRLAGKSDNVLRVLCQELGFSATRLKSPTWPKESRVLVPYDLNGRRLPEDSKAPRMWLDLRDMKKVRLSPGHNIQGARQQQFMHIDADEPIKLNGVLVQPAPPTGVVISRDAAKSAFQVQIGGVTFSLGIWWLEVAMRGAVEVLPLVNEKPEFEKASRPAR